MQRVRDPPGKRARKRERVESSLWRTTGVPASGHGRLVDLVPARSTTRDSATRQRSPRIRADPLSTPRRRPKYFPFDLAWMLRTGTRERIAGDPGDQSPALQTAHCQVTRHNRQSRARRSGRGARMTFDLSPSEVKSGNQLNRSPQNAARLNADTDPASRPTDHAVTRPPSGRDHARPFDIPAAIPGTLTINNMTRATCEQVMEEVICAG